MARIAFRPHHFLCALGYQGKGYSEAFTDNMTEIVCARLRGPDGDSTTLEVTRVSDAICAPCPKRRGTGCAENQKIATLDTAHAEALNLRPGDTLTWGDAKKRMAHLPDDIHDRICTGCQWKDFGLCRDALLDLKTRN